MASTEVSGRIFQKNLMEIIKDLVWKNDYLAKQAEAECDRIYTDKYESAARKLLEYYTVTELKLITDETREQFMKRLNNAPSHLHKFLTTFWSYEEPNRYYRMLYGKPPLDYEPRHGVYPRINNPWGLDPNKSFHDAPLNILLLIENDGGLDYYKELIETDKTFLYVTHMTHRKIYPFVARLAQSFDLLYIPEAEIGALSRDFREVYQMCRDFMVIRYYSEAYYNHYEHYEGIMGMSILFQTIQQMHVKYLDADITRDFYDLDSIRVVYDAYSVPFFENIPIFYHQKIVKLMNRLLMYKGGNQVFFDLCALFDYESLDVFKYYLCKTQEFTDEGHPKVVYTESGNIDYERTYKVFFAKGLLDGDPYVDIIDPNNHLDYWAVTHSDPYWFNDEDLLQKIYRTEYNFTETKYIGLQMVFSMTKFLLETGYFLQMLVHNRHTVSSIRVSHGKLGVDIDLFTLVVYIHAIIYTRLGYAGNIPDSLEKRARVIGFNFKDDLGRIIEDIKHHKSEYHKHASNAGDKVHGDNLQNSADNIIEGKLGTNEEGYVIFIPNDPDNKPLLKSVLYVYNDSYTNKSYVWSPQMDQYVEYLIDNVHNTDIDGDNHEYGIGQNIYDDLMMIDNSCDADKILALLEDMYITNLSSCARVYDNIKELYSFIEDRILRCKDPDTYFAYKHLYKLLLTTEETSDIFLKSDGTVANTIFELLEDLNMSLAIRISSMSDTQLVQELQYSLAALEKTGAELKYIQSYGGIHGKIISEYLYQLIRVFKSAKVDLVDFKAIYIFDGRMTNLIKLMVKLKLSELSRDLPANTVLELNDDVRLRMIGGCNREAKYDLYPHRNPATGKMERCSKTCSGFPNDCKNCDGYESKPGCVIREFLPLIDEYDMLYRLVHLNDESFALAFKDIVHNVELIRRHAIANDKLPLIDDIHHRTRERTIIHDGILEDRNMFVDKLIKLE